MIKKICSKCKKEKELMCFGKHLSSKDGLKGQCKECRKVESKLRYKENKEELSTYYKKRYEQNKNKILEGIKKYAMSKRGKFMRKKRRTHRLKYDEEFKKKHTARKILNHRIENGSIIKPSICSKCRISGVTIQGHHKDYSKPLDVDWLCEKCHRKLHAC